MLLGKSQRHRGCVRFFWGNPMLNTSSSSKNIVSFVRNNPVAAFATVTIVVLAGLLLLSLLG
jgi:hypothetical protein